MKLGILLVLFGASEAYNIYCDSHSYKAVANPVYPTTDAHCQAQCNQFVGVPAAACPHDQCMCAGPQEEPSTDYCTSPRSCPFNKYEPNYGTTVAGSQWCQNNCNPVAGQRNCPCTMCLCGNPCSAGENLVKMSFDEFAGYNIHLIRTYKGFNFRNMYSTNPPNIYPQSGYANAVKSKPVVAFNGFANPIVFSEANKNKFKFVSASFTGAWQNGVKVTVIGRLMGTEVFKWEALTCTECRVRPEDNSHPAPVFGEVDEVTILSTPGTEDPAYPRGSGAHLAIEDMLVCAPSSAEREVLEKRSVTEDGDISSASDGPMAAESKDSL
eukprot:TRINITY_DN79789_c0_g1_i1.p1 TRINITY_DN79789_c0_g1~~TRINITY_DN79789_c0_g1_i1.p1  ORF type:complete len:325 (+),score=11.08 TRINITY_DN79789_c0_g1_i1:157-1131(+)